MCRFGALFSFGYKLFWLNIPCSIPVKIKSVTISNDVWTDSPFNKFRTITATTPCTNDHILVYGIKDLDVWLHYFKALFKRKNLYYIFKINQILREEKNNTFLGMASAYSLISLSNDGIVAKVLACLVE